MQTSLPLGTNNSGLLDMIPVEDFFDCTSLSLLLFHLFLPLAVLLDVNNTIGAGSELFAACQN